MNGVMRMRLLSALLVLAFAAWGLEVRSDDAAKPFDPATGTAEIKGTVKFTGEAPKRKPVDMGAEAGCAAKHPEPQLSESVIVNGNGSLKNVFVYVKQGLEGYAFKPPADPVVLNQNGCMYVPHVAGVMVGQPFRILNQDDWAHNVHGMPKQNSDFNFGQPKAGVTNDVTFTTPEILVRVKCDIHGWMSAFVGVVSHPYFAVTGDDGSFSLKGLPPGDYVIEAVHEKLGKVTQNVKVGDKESKAVDFTIEAK